MSNRHTFVRYSVSAILAIAGLSISMLSYAEEDPTLHQAGGNSSITVEQKNVSDGKSLGTWTIIKPGNTKVVSSSGTNTLTNLPAGSYSFFVESPDGATPTVRVYRGDHAEPEVLPRPQVTLKIGVDENIRFLIHYTLTKTGTVSVQSDPPGMEFVVTGPNNFNEKGVTPASYDGISEGQYKVQYVALEGCVTPPPQSHQLVIGGRASFDVIASCKSADKLRARGENKGTDFVVISIDKEDVTLRDVPQKAWFSSFVFNAARRNVLAGYKDADGKPSGLFGPENYVTIAELAKIAHRLGSDSEQDFARINPTNAKAVDTWFSPFFASAEAKGWTIYQDTTIDPLRPATRAEVVITFLQVMDVPLRWQKGQMFTDVTVRTQYAAAIETAAEDGIISGRTDENGASLGIFAPQDPINRAEISKIINGVFQVYLGEETEDDKKRN